VSSTFFPFHIEGRLKYIYAEAVLLLAISQGILDCKAKAFLQGMFGTQWILQGGPPYFSNNLSLSFKTDVLVAPFSLHFGSNSYSSIRALCVTLRNLALAAVQATINRLEPSGPSGMCWI